MPADHPFKAAREESSVLRPDIPVLTGPKGH